MTVEKVLVAIPYRAGVLREFITGITRLASALEHPDIDLCVFPNTFSTGPGGGKYSPHAAARNALIDTCLCPRHTHVLWLDCDLISVPPDLVARLLAVDPDGIVAPFPFVELIPGEAPSLRGGGWFYDIFGFVKDGKFPEMWPPYFDCDISQPFQLESVGCCYIAPAWLYRNGLRYEARDGHVEHVRFMQAAREAGVRVWATASVRVEHAYLPRFGLPWNG